jgi:RNA polymerase sigma factor (sigma-70 family)
MRDRDIVSAIVAGDPVGLAAAYDAYAASLHAYCRRLLADPADAADAVRDTFVIAAVKVVALRDRDRLRPWLYAVARNECHRRLRDRARQVGLDETSEITIASADVAALAEDEELQSLVPAAIGGLNLGDREVIELNLRHDLDGADLADALGVPASEVHALVSRARGQLERSLGALLVARTGRGQCAELDAILGHWDGRLTVPLRRRVSGHIQECGTCGARPHRELTPAMLASILPLVVLPAGLRQQVLQPVSDADPDAAASRDEVVARAGEFGYSGFPEQIAPAGGSRRSEAAGRPDTLGGPAALSGPSGPGASGKPTRRALLGVAALVILLVGGGVATYLLLNGTGPASGAAGGDQAVMTLPSSGVGPVSVSSPSPASADLTTTPSASPGRSAPGASSTPKSGPGGTSPPVSPSSRPTGGTLTESPGIVQLPRATVGGLSIGSFTLTAVGGPVTYAISGGGLYLSVSPASGTLAAGQTATVSVSLTLNPNGAPPPSNTTLTVSPADLTVSVEYPVSALTTGSRR